MYDYMQEIWERELEADLQEQAELAADIRREHEEAEEDLRRELESYEDWDLMDEDYSAANPWDAPGMRVSDFVRGVKCF